MSGGSFRVSIPSAMRRTIQNIKEITGNHSDEEVYAMLKECGMDPNETTQKLLLQDTFHEVKRKRDKRKENNRSQADPRWRPGVLGRGGRVSRGGYSSRYVSTDAGGGRNPGAGKENGVNQSTEKGNSSTSSPTSPDMEKKFSISTSSPATGLPSGPTKADHVTSSQGCVTSVSDDNRTVSAAVHTAEAIDTESTSLVPDDVKKISASGQPVRNSKLLLQPTRTGPISGVNASASHPVLVQPLDTCVPGAVGIVKHEIGSQCVVVEATGSKGLSFDVTGSGFQSASREVSSGLINSNDLRKVEKKPQIEPNWLSETSHVLPSNSLTSSIASRPSSAYSIRPQHLSGPQKVLSVVPGKEWKPKSSPINLAQPSGIPCISDAAPAIGETVDRSQPASSATAADVTTLNLGKKLEKLQFSETQHVIIPHHLQVPESQRHGLSFGSFDSSFKLNPASANVLACEDISEALSESSQEIEENTEGLSRIHNESLTAPEAEVGDRHEEPVNMADNLSREADSSFGISPVPEFDEPKADKFSVPEGPQYSIVHTTPTYSTFGFVPQMLGSQVAPFENTEPQAHDAARIPSFVVQQPYDPSTSYYTQIYRPCADGDGRFSPFLAPGAASKYNGNIAVAPAHTGLFPQEGGNSLVLTSSTSTPLATQAAGLMQSSVAVTQQPLPVFRQPAGLHISHFPPNYIPYSQYFSPFYPSPPALHHFLSNAVFPQQPPTGSMYPPPTGAAAAATVKFPMSQYKPGTNTVNSNHVGVPAYGTYNSTPTGYNPNSTAADVNATGNEDLTTSQYKENSIYITGQQSEGSAVWMPSAGREVPGLQVNSFYNLPRQGQHMSFTPTQASHGVVPGVYPPTPSVGAASVHPLLQQSPNIAGAEGGPAGVYQQPQCAQINWTNNY